MQNYSNSIANALELLQSCTMPSTYNVTMRRSGYRQVYDSHILTKDTSYLAHDISIVRWCREWLWSAGKQFVFLPFLVWPAFESVRLRYPLTSGPNACSETEWVIKVQDKQLELDSPSIWWASIQLTSCICNYLCHFIVQQCYQIQKQIYVPLQQVNG